MNAREELNRIFSVDAERGILFSAVNRGKLKVGDVCGWRSAKGYINVCVRRKSYPVHSVIWFLANGNWPKQIDHINGVKDDNRISNLRDCTAEINQQNKVNPVGNSKARLIGASWHKGTGKWQSKITANGKLYYLGLFDSKDEAHMAYLCAKKILHPCASALIEMINPAGMPSQF